MYTKNPFLYFDFKQFAHQGTPLAFSDPIDVLIANQHDDVIPCLQQIIKKVSAGYYAAGYLSYEAAPAFNPSYQAHEQHELPLLWFGIFREPIEISDDYWQEHSFSISEWQPNIAFTEYTDHVHKIKEYIHRHVTEQVNYTVRLTSKFSGDTFSFFKQLAKTQAANYHAYLNIEPYSILSVSPELFFHIKDQHITTRPMKGTIHRGKTYEEDLMLAKWLQSSDKNRQENKLITNLMIEELSNIAEPNTIKVENQFSLEKYPTLYQMTSTIKARLSANIDLIDVFQALFPNGSITGIPKQNTMKLIKQLEHQPREVFSGAIGYITPAEEAIFNVPIRTVIVNNKTEQAVYGVGGAITKQSNAKEEFQEIMTKAKLLTTPWPTFKLLETFGLIDGKYLVFENHLNRLKQSARYFNYPINEDKIRKALIETAKQYARHKWKVRLLLDEKGQFSISTEEIEQQPTEIIVALADHPIDKNNIFHYHKTTYRNMYEQVGSKNTRNDISDWILWNENREVTEFTQGNIVIKMNGKLFTPPVACGLLPGTFREELIKKKIINEQNISIDDLHRCEQIWFINSVREWIPVKIVD